MISIIQGNMHRSKLANDLLHRLASEKAVHLLLLSEQYKDYDSPSWYADLTGTAAIWVFDSGRIRVSKSGKGNGFVWVTFGQMTIFSVYCTPNESIHAFREKLNALEDAVLGTDGLKIVAGDVNAKAIEWGMPQTDSRGRYVLEMAARTGLLVLNVGGVSTFRRPGCAETIPDVSLASEALFPRIMQWKVLEDFTGSDHQYISFEIGDRRPLGTVTENSNVRWNPNNIDENKFSNVIRWGTGPPIGPQGRSSTEELVQGTMELITMACDASMQRKRPRHGKAPVYWWTQDIAALRRRCHALRRAAQRARNREEATVKTAEFRIARRNLRRSINKSKARCWRELMEDVNRDPWGLGYKLVTQKLGALRPVSAMDAATMERIVGTLFPTHPIRLEDVSEIVEDIPPFTAEELTLASQSLKGKKAPGPDGVPYEALKLVVRHNPALLLNLYNECLLTGVFPSRWKLAKLVLISKGKGDPEQASSYRPLCLLDTAGKLLEKLIRPRLISAIREAGDLSPCQYGFRTGRSTIDAIMEVVHAVQRAEAHGQCSRRVVLLVTLDVKNAFNSARWKDMIKALENDFSIPKYLLRMLKDYLNDRSLFYETSEGLKRIQVTSGAAQGSILGPDLWNVSYDSLLRLNMPEESCLVGYADDVAALIAARSVELAQLKLNQAMRKILSWMEEHGLSLALQKTEVVVLTKKRIPNVLPIRIAETTVESRPAVKYLGLMVDSKLTFFEQIRRTADKAAAGVNALSRLMSNVGGPSSSKRRLLMTAVQSAILYGAEVWADALDKKSYAKRLMRVQRRSALRVASAYRTVSEPAVLLIAGVVPVTLLAKERRRLYLARREGVQVSPENERAATLREWQRLWSEEHRGRWTSRLIPEVDPWIYRKHGEVDYFVTQFLSGHGYFRSYLYKIGKIESPECLFCPGQRDDAEHTFFSCKRWELDRLAVFSELSQCRPETIVKTMLETHESWNRVTHYIRKTLTMKKAIMDRQ